MTTCEPRWHTSSHSAQEGRCVEVAEGPGVLVRDTAHRALGHLPYPAGAWASFLLTLSTHRP
jgi:hypothetical protein